MAWAWPRGHHLPVVVVVVGVGVGVQGLGVLWGDVEGGLLNRVGLAGDGLGDHAAAPHQRRRVGLPHLGGEESQNRGGEESS